MEWSERSVHSRKIVNMLLLKRNTKRELNNILAMNPLNMEILKKIHVGKSLKILVEFFTSSPDGSFHLPGQRYQACL